MKKSLSLGSITRPGSLGIISAYPEINKTLLVLSTISRVRTPLRWRKDRHGLPYFITNSTKRPTIDDLLPYMSQTINYYL
ncbi:hypothetical protein [Zobellia amurskyensis]|uniref:hypothetical protein n=1 Tax=Zobellia amurskyensis TaxID=248905 RepID=UPI0012D878B7|nr:hypothetical protein [Zobellia amurskyensis]